MKERFKKLLTKEKALGDYAVLYKEHSKDNFGCLIWCLLLIWVPVLGILAILGLIAWVLAEKFGEKAADPKKLTSEDFEFIEDTVVKKEREDDGDSCSYYLCFEKTGRESVLRSDSNHPFWPIYDEVEVGDRFFVAKIDPLIRPCFYPEAQWRLTEPTQEEIAREIQEEEALIARLIACERFPRLTMRKTHYADSDPKRHLVPRDKPEAEKNLLERFAGMYFAGDMLAAIEFILRYCPEALQEEVGREYTQRQWLLQNAVAECLKADRNEQKRKELVQKVKSVFSGSEKNE